VAKTDQYFRALEQAIEEYERLKRQREEIETRLAQLRQTITALAPLCRRDSAHHLDEIGLTDACRSVLRASLGPLPPVEVKHRLAATGVDLSGYSNPMASIHTILKRLAAAGEVRRVTTAGKTAYWWKRPVVPLVLPEGGTPPDWWSAVAQPPPGKRKKE
jgi:hypothetical protein